MYSVKISFNINNIFFPNAAVETVKENLFCKMG